MAQTDALHTAARRYCLERYDALRAQSDRFRAWGGVGNAFHLHPRWAVVDAILTAVEGVVPSAVPFPHVLAEHLVEVGHTAQSLATRTRSWRESSIAEVMGDERLRFAQAVRTLAATEPLDVEPLPHRRTVLAEERAGLWERLSERWQVGGRWWIPWGDVTLGEEVMVVDAAALRDGLGDAALRDILDRQGVHYVFELWQHDSEPDREWAVADVKVRSGWGERFWFSPSLDWLIYTTHEGSAAIAGECLLADVKARWPTWAEHPYVEPCTMPVTLTPEERAAENARPDPGLRWRFLGAAGAGKVEQLAALLAQGVDINVQGQKEGTALHWAAARGQEGSIRFLLEHGADLNARSTAGITTLMSAVSNGHVGVMRLLMERGADVNVRAEDTPEVGPRAGRTALGIAKASEYLAALGDGRRAEVISLLLDAPTGEGDSNIHRGPSGGAGFHP